ncbi:Putative ABC transporter [Acididesulfobacillus acetoxydans]|uniref:ABC transporter n=1 Tax=Acididesulfobacillus acetoxydans TaxID=1561005 RepID=A0A8S0X4A8_9FIRM|nr:ABC transporter ATP-binding protein [Acididesulfobacillus acetoxydans]CAA7600670.1 Putative ABC transporter [Acididesulfobacillus acetoxydans]CEJ09451.1 Nickel import ATP-binding protein NikO [Acididesulfobacillus acetoxydans]
MTKSIPLFTLRSVSYNYLPDKPVLTQINLDLYQGESLAILGANGSGKSTLLKLLCGLIFPTAGEITAFGQTLSEESLRNQAFLQNFRQQVGFVFQNSDAQLFSATVWDELAFAPLQAGLPTETVQTRVRDTAELLGIQHLLERPPYRLSGGEKKKVALASVLAVNPEVLFLDEPTNGLDPRTQFWLVEFLTALKDAGKTVIIATHDLSIVEDIAERVIVIREDHTLAADGPTLKILSDRNLLLDVNLIHERSHFHVGAARHHG